MMDTLAAPAPEWASQTYYFKAGDYVQNNE